MVVALMVKAVLCLIMVCKGCGLIHDPLIRCEVAAAQASSAQASPTIKHDVQAPSKVTVEEVGRVTRKHFSRAGKAGGAKGGPARARVLSPERRSEIARAGALARWRK